MWSITTIELYSSAVSSPLGLGYIYKEIPPSLSPFPNGTATKNVLDCNNFSLSLLSKLRGCCQSLSHYNVTCLHFPCWTVVEHTMILSIPLKYRDPCICLWSFVSHCFKRLAVSGGASQWCQSACSSEEQVLLTLVLLKNKSDVKRYPEDLIINFINNESSLVHTIAGVQCCLID